MWPLPMGRKIVRVSAFCFVIAGAPAYAGALREARINKIINQVHVVDHASGSRKAELQQVIKDDLGVKTGIKSRSELLFQDSTLTRLGSESFFRTTPALAAMAPAPAPSAGRAPPRRRSAPGLNREVNRHAD